MITLPGDGAFPKLEVVPAAPEQQSTLANLLELYIHDFSEFCNVTIQADGRFGYPSLSLYWSEAGRHPFLIRLDGKLAGLVLVKEVAGAEGNVGAWDMAEFFIVRGCRKRGIGTQAAHEIWRRFPGRWQVRVMKANGSARHFWTRVISTFVGEVISPTSVETGGVCWTLFSFESRRDA